MLKITDDVNLKELEEAIENIKEQLKRTKIANECGLATKGEFSKDIQALETVLNYIEILETATNNKYPYVIGGRTLYSRLQQLDKEDLIKAYLRLRNETKQLIKDIENSISKKKVEEILQKNRNELFSTTYVEPRQYEPFKMQIERINKIGKELLEGK